MAKWVAWRNRSENKARAKEIARVNSALHRARYPERIIERRISYYERNRARIIERIRIRDGEIYSHVPSWLTAEQLLAIDEVYECARKLTKDTGILHHVDHIWPLKGKNSCGLHVPWNLQVLTQFKNDSKHNREPYT